MKRELDYFRIGESYGGNQDWFLDPMMRIGGCAALTACDSCIYFSLYRGMDLYPYEQNPLSKRDYLRFGMRMKPYLRPRWSGIDRLEIYIDGFQKYLADCGCESLRMLPFSGNQEVSGAKTVLEKQIDAGIPVPCLLLNHQDPKLKDYEWHWFLLTGYERTAKTYRAKAVTYGGGFWLDFEALWDTGYLRRGGLVEYILLDKGKPM